MTVYCCGRRGTIRPIRVGDRTFDRAELREWLLTQPRRAELDPKNEERPAVGPGVLERMQREEYKCIL